MIEKILEKYSFKFKDRKEIIQVSKTGDNCYYSNITLNDNDEFMVSVTYKPTKQCDVWLHYEKDLNKFNEEFENWYFKKNG